MRALVLNIVRRKARKLKVKGQALQEVATALRCDLLENPGNEDALKSLEQVNNQIKHMEWIKTEASIFRSRAKWFRDGEVSSKFFFALEKRNYLSKNMKCVIDDDGKVISDQKGILDEQTRFLLQFIPEK